MKREYKYVVYLNGIVWDLVKAPCIRVAKNRAYDEIVRQFKAANISSNVPMSVEVQTIKSFLGR